MTFDPDKLDAFLLLFETTKDKILASKGCQHLELLQSEDQPNVCMTWSFWDSIEDLNEYRNSALFAVTWKTTKQWFTEKPQAISWNPAG